MINASAVCEVEKIIGVNFNNKKLLSEALIHSSFVKQDKYKNRNLADNERLEFLGDSILNLVISDYLYKKYPDLPEGDLTKIRAAIVGKQACIDVGRSLALDSFISVGVGVRVNNVDEVVIGRGTEAIIGAVFLDQGYEPAFQCVIRFFGPMAEQIISSESWADPKMKLQEKTQQLLGVLPRYELMDEHKHENNTYTYTMSVYINDELIGQGQGSSKTNAQKEAARNALHKKGW